MPGRRASRSPLPLAFDCYATKMFCPPWYWNRGPGWLGLSFSNWAGTYVECPLHGRNLLREQDDIEGIHLRLREVYGTIPRIPAVYADVFRSSVQHCIIELRISQDTLVVGAGPTDW